MEIKTFEDAKPYIAYIMHDTNPNGYYRPKEEKEWNNDWIDVCASKYVALASKEMDVDYNELLTNLKVNGTILSFGNIVREEYKTFLYWFTDNPQPVYAARVNIDTYNGKINCSEVTSGYFRSRFEELWDKWHIPLSLDEFNKPFPPQKIVDWKNGKTIIVGDATMIDTLHFCTDLKDKEDNFYPRGGYAQTSVGEKERSLGYTISDADKGYSVCEILKFFTTEEEAKAFVNEWNNKKLSKSQECVNEENRIEKTYGNILSLVKKLSKEELSELKDLIEDIRSQKIADAKLNPLQLCYEYMDDAQEIQDFIIEQSELRGWIEEHYDMQRFELIEFSDIFNAIISDYPEDVAWKNIKKKDKPLIKELSEWFQDGFRGFKCDW